MDSLHNLGMHLASLSLRPSPAFLADTKHRHPGCTQAPGAPIIVKAILFFILAETAPDIPAPVNAQMTDRDIVDFPRVDRLRTTE
jgi:hypothetical protein